MSASEKILLTIVFFITAVASIKNITQDERMDAIERQCAEQHQRR